jgi:hypothetical protein
VQIITKTWKGYTGLINFFRLQGIGIIAIVRLLIMPDCPKVRLTTAAIATTVRTTSTAFSLSS